MPLIAVAYPHDDPMGTALGTLTDLSELTVTVEADGLGSGSLTINRNSDQSSWTDPGNYIAVWIDAQSGVPVAGFWIADGSDVLLSSSEEGGEDWARSGPGPMKVLDEAIVWHVPFRGGRLATVQRRKGRWIFRGSFQLAQVLLRMVREAKERGCIPFVTFSFDAGTDSDGEAWPDETEVGYFAVPIGITLHELVTMLRAKGLRIEMDARFRIHAWPEERENDLSGSITIEAGENIREELQRSSRAGRMRSHVLVGGERHTGAERYVPFSRSDIRETLGRREEGFRDTGKTNTRRALTRVGRRTLRRWKNIKDGPLTVPVIDTPGQIALVDYQPGDTVTLTVPGAYSGGHAPLAITLAMTPNGDYDPVLEFGALTPDRSGEDFSDDAATAVRS